MIRNWSTIESESLVYEIDQDPKSILSTTGYKPWEPGGTILQG